MGTKDVLFIHIAKTAGTSLVDTFGIKKYPTGFCQSGRAYFLHKTPIMIRDFGLADWNWLQRCFKFTFVRNPYDRAVSHYFYCKQHLKWGVKESTTFLEYCQGPMREYRHHGPMVQYFERIKYDFVGRFETFEQDVERLAEMLGDPKPTLSHLNASNRKPYQEMLCKDSKRIIEEFYAEDFDKFNYERE